MIFTLEKLIDSIIGTLKQLFPSPSARKVWIEILVQDSLGVAVGRRLPQGRCGLKFGWYADYVGGYAGRLPQGRCGLK